MSNSSNLVFTLAVPSESNAIRDLVRAAYARWVPVIGREPRPMQADYAAAILVHRIDLLHEGSRLVGLIETLMHHDHLWIENVAVAPDAQRLGYGRHLLAHAETLARQADKAELRLLTNAAFVANVALYERLGYGVMHSEPFMGGTTLYMSKRLTPGDAQTSSSA